MKDISSVPQYTNRDKSPSGTFRAAVLGDMAALELSCGTENLSRIISIMKRLIAPVLNVCYDV